MKKKNRIQIWTMNGCVRRLELQSSLTCDQKRIIPKGNYSHTNLDLVRSLCEDKFTLLYLDDKHFPALMPSFRNIKTQK